VTEGAGRPAAGKNRPIDESINLPARSAAGGTSREGQLAASDGTLQEAYDALLVDLDGVVHLGDQPIPRAADALAAARAAGLKVVFVTNNASRTPAEVALALFGYGVAATAEDVVTSSVVAVRLLAERLPGSAAVLVVGGEGLRGPLAAAGLTPVAEAEEAVAVVQGWAPDVDWRQLAEASVALRRGVPWVATNLDRTLPSPRGPLPGNGSLVAALAIATGREPESVGKPKPAMFTGAAAAMSAARPLVIGDRLDTDIAGARAAGYPSLAVLTGVSSPRDLLAATPEQRPSYLGSNLDALQRRHAAPVIDSAGARCRDITVTDHGDVRGPADGSSGAGADGLDGLRAACALGWSGRLRPELYDGVLKALHLD
jgi:HAD superfamily hydrolase (TIGR01450 family)